MKSMLQRNKMLSVVILAAGFGTRMKSKEPKVLHKICGKSMIEYVIDVSLQISEDLHVILYNQQEKIRNFLQTKYEQSGDKITLHKQPYEKYPGTGGALMDEDGKLIALRGEKVLVLSGDTPLITKLELIRLTNSSAAINLAMFETNDAYGYGRIIKKDGRNNPCEIIGIVEEKDCTKEQRQITSVNGGIYCFDKAILQTYIQQLDNNNVQREYYLTQIVSLACRDSNRAFAFLCCEKNLFGVNTKLHLAAAEQIMLERIRNRAMEQGVIMQIPESIYLDYDVSFEGECLLENGTRITGKSHIKESHIKAHSVVEQSEIIQSDIGPHAHIRPNSKIRDSYVGNFVECKNADLQGVKAGHLSYLGDCVVGEGSNIGAGVITCNYDGVKKHKTNIGKNVFVGSDCQLVAPVNISSNVLIGAGSTITKDIDEGSLALSRSKQTNYPNGFYKFFAKK